MHFQFRASQKGNSVSAREMHKVYARVTEIARDDWYVHSKVEYMRAFTTDIHKRRSPWEDIQAGNVFAARVPSSRV